MLSVRFRRLEMLIFRKILGTYNVGPKSENTHLANPKSLGMIISHLMESLAIITNG